MLASTAIYQHPVDLLQNLVRFDSCRGNEGPCIAYINALLTEAGLATLLIADPATPDRPNLIARLPGQGIAPPLLMQGHVDVMPAERQIWQHPPFEGRLIDGNVWGRGALDMKGGVAMMLAALLRARAEGVQPAGDIILAALCDEEDGSDHGAKYLVENYASLFDGVHYAIGEFGGFTFYSGRQRFYPIQVLEKQVCRLQLTVRGPGGHGSAPVRGGAMARLADALRCLDRQRLPVHINPFVRQMVTEMAASSPPAARLMLRLLLIPTFTDHILELLGDRARVFDPLLHNTVSPTIVKASSKVNVIPSQVDLEMDARLLPGFKPDDLQAEVRALLGPKIELTIDRYDPGVAKADMGLYETLAGILREQDPAGIPIPLVLNAVTDGRFFSRLGIQTYGFTPMKLPNDLSLLQLAHGADERIPAEAITFGSDAIYKLLQRYGAPV